MTPIILSILVLLAFLLMLLFRNKSLYKEGYLSKPNPTIVSPNPGTIGFIILRHVNSEQTNKYWNKSYDQVRKYYPDNPIMIIDDNSDYKFVKREGKMNNYFVINSLYKKRGELLPYYYFLLINPFEKAVIIHDSVFINKYIDFSNVENFKILWHFFHEGNMVEAETEILNVYDDQELIDFYNNGSAWIGCFGAMSVITYDCVKNLNEKYNLDKLLPLIYSREKRMCFERVIACLLQKEFGKAESLFGEIYQYCNWGITWDEHENVSHLPMTKIWSGR